MPAFSKKAGIVLWALDQATAVDDMGSFLTTPEIAERFRMWSVVSPQSAGAEVSKVKADLFDRNYIMMAGGRDHIHLTASGKEAVKNMRERVASAMGESLKTLDQADRRVLPRLIGALLSGKPAQPREVSEKESETA